MSSKALPRISIVTPSFNQGAYVDWTVRSVVEQRYQNLEYIFMDGGSTDETLTSIEKFRSKFSHFETGPDGGQSAAIAKGFERASGDILAYLNSDDVLLPGALSFVSKFFDDHPDVDVIYSHRCIIDEENRVIGHWILPPHINSLMKRWDLIPQETTFWRRRMFEKAGNVDPSFRFAMDYDLFVRYMTVGKFRRVNRFLAAFRVHDAAKTSTQVHTVGKEEVEQIRKKYGLRAPQLIGRVYSLSVRLRSAYALKKRVALPGLPPGDDFSISELWNWQLPPSNLTARGYD